MHSIYTPTNPRKLIKVPELSLDEFADRLSALGLSQMKIHQLSDISRLRLRAVLEKDPKTNKTNGTVFRWMTLLLILLESGLLYEDAIEDHSFEKLQEILKKAVDTQ